MTNFQRPAKKENERMNRQFYLQMFAQPSKALPRDNPSYLTVAAPVPVSDHTKGTANPTPSSRPAICTRR